MGDEEEKVYAIQYLDGEEESTNWVSRAGRATATYANGDIYEGDFAEDKTRTGQGTYTWNNTKDEDAEEPMATYTGAYVAGKREGQGTMTSASGTYTGAWAGGKREGMGTWTSENGKYRGEWKAGKQDGQGVYQYANGDLYSGSWSEGKKHGQGTYLFTTEDGRDDCQYIGNWDQGDFASGRWKLRDGSTFEGEFVANKPSGDGTYKFQNGNVQLGEYIERRLEGDQYVNDETETRFLGGAISA